MGLSSLTRDQTRAPVLGAGVLATGPPEKSLLIFLMGGKRKPGGNSILLVPREGWAALNQPIGDLTEQAECQLGKAGWAEGRMLDGCRRNFSQCPRLSPWMDGEAAPTKGLGGCVLARTKHLMLLSPSSLSMLFWFLPCSLFYPSPTSYLPPGPRPTHLAC